MSNLRLIIHFSFVAVFSLLASITHAAVPDNIDYQGYLADSGGSPVSSTVSVSFSLYNIDTGGVALWSDTQSLTPDNGLFNVKLGSVGNPLPPGLFDGPVYIGINVAGDGEMLPRVAMSSAGFAHKANDADSVGGVAATALATSSDLSSHAADAGAHHSKTSTFTELSGQASDAQIPATIARGTDLSAHAGDSAAHHSRYTNNEAVAAMGLKADVNPLHHNRPTDKDIIDSVKTLDGPGSGLDADLVDGMQASEIIDAASDEVRTPISSLPFAISLPGSYYLTGNLDGSSGGIEIASSNVVLDMMGFTITGGPASGHGIYNTGGASNIVIMNGTVSGFQYHGIGTAFSTSTGIKVNNVSALNNGSAGIFLSGKYNHIENCLSKGNAGYGIYAADNSRVINCTAAENTGLYGIRGGRDTILERVIVTGHNNVTAHSIYVDVGGNVLNSTVSYNNCNYGIYVSGGLAKGNSVNDNSVATGLTVSGGGLAVENTVRTTTGLYGIYLGTASQAIGNTVYANTGTGIYGIGSNQVIRNNIYNNNTSISANSAGISISTDSTVADNNLDLNRVNNIVVRSNGTVIERNTISDSTNGIRFDTSGNFYANNRASGNTTNYNLGATSQTNGGGNFSF